MQQFLVRGVWLLSLIVGLALAGMLAFSVWSRIGALDTAQQDQREWLYSQLEVEFLKLMEAVKAVEASDDVGLDDLRVRFDVFYSRVNLAATTADGMTGPKEKIDSILSSLDGFIPVIDGPDLGLREQLGVLEGLLEDQRATTREVALDSISMEAQASELERNQIIYLIEVLVSVILVVAAFFIYTIYILLLRTNSLHEASTEAKFNGARLDSMLRASSDGVIVVNEYGLVQELNGSAEAMFDYDREELLGKPIAETLMPPKHRTAFENALAEYRRTREPYIAEKGRMEWKMKDKGGRVFVAEIVASQVKFEDDSLFIAYVRDITDAKEKEAEVLKMRDEALNAYKEKSRFFAMMSHEMRTPLNGVISALQLLGDGELSDEQRGYLSAAVASGDILLGHINDVLAIERIESDENVEKQAVDIAALTSTIYGAMAPFANVAGVQLHISQAGLDDRMVMTDPKALQQILVNLLSNGIKFSPKGKVTLSALYDTADATAGPDIVVFEVRDSGVGISEDHIEQIFDDFVSLDSSYERRTGGTGLGLGIVKRLVQRLGGKISCTSELGVGTIFRIEVPAVAATEKDLPLAGKRAASIELPPQNCLVVDDNAVNRDLMRAMLKHMGHRVVLAQSGPEAIELAKETAFDVILMDISMPGMNGMEATHAIQNGAGPSAGSPFIAVTAHALPRQRAEFREAGLSGFIEKPVRRESLARVLAEQCAGLTIVRSSPGDGLGAKALSQHIDQEQISELREVIGDEAFAVQVEKFLPRVDQDMAALMLLTSLPDIRAAAHALAGMCGVMGAKKMHQLGRDIQDACDAGASDQVCDHLGVAARTWPRTRLAFAQLVESTAKANSTPADGMPYAKA